MNKLYVLLLYFWEGDGYLINEFKGIFDSIESVPEEIKNHKAVFKNRQGDILEPKYKGFYLPGEVLPEEDDGHYGSPSFYATEEVEMNKIKN